MEVQESWRHSPPVLLTLHSVVAHQQHLRLYKYCVSPRQLLGGPGKIRMEFFWNTCSYTTRRSEFRVTENCKCVQCFFFTRHREVESRRLTLGLMFPTSLAELFTLPGSSNPFYQILLSEDTPFESSQNPPAPWVSRHT